MSAHGGIIPAVCKHGGYAFQAAPGGLQGSPLVRHGCMHCICTALRCTYPVSERTGHERLNFGPLQFLCGNRSEFQTDIIGGSCSALMSARKLFDAPFTLTEPLAAVACRGLDDAGRVALREQLLLRDQHPKSPLHLPLHRCVKISQRCLPLCKHRQRSEVFG